MPSPTVLTVDIARRALAVVDAGLVYGMGEPVPGAMCVEAAICYALGLEHGDDPGCVASAVRAFKISLNDRRGWSSRAARALGLRELAIVQLGSTGIDGAAFTRWLAEQTTRQIVPLALRAAGARQGPAHADALNAAASRCEQEGTVAAAWAAEAAAGAAQAAAGAAAWAAARDAAEAAAWAARDAARAARDAVRAAVDARAAADAAEAAAWAARDASSDRIFTLSASLACAILRDLGTEGAALWDVLHAEAGAAP
jgi:hypothetical protein